MKKRRIAILANGWNSENLSNFLMGITGAAAKESMDFFVFLSYASYGYNEISKKAEGLIYELPDLKSFDAIVIFGPGLNFPEVIEKIQNLADEAGVPVVSIGIRHKGHYYIGADNYLGMKVLTDHMIEKHNVKNILYVAGSEENDDSNQRMKAIIDSAKEHGVPFGESNVFYSNWEQGRILDYIRSSYKDSKDFPDVFMCANDQLAIAVNQAMERTYNLEPNSIKITGFDYLDQSKTFYPSITTVDQRYNKIGEKACEILNGVFKGKELPYETMVGCECKIGESCGCGYSRKAMQNRRSYIRRMQWEQRLAMNKEGRLFVMERCISQSQSYKQAAETVQSLICNTPGGEGNTFYMTFAPFLEKVGDKEENELPKLSLDDSYLVVAGKKDGVPVNSDNVDRKTVVPGYTGEGDNSVFLITMLRSDDLICGYLIMGMDPYEIRRNDLYDYQGRIDRAFFTYIRNLQLNTLNKKLADLMEQDSLTHVKNRTAYDKYVKSFMTRVSVGEIKEYAVAYFDINNLKVINDEYGHEAGDAYIRNSCKLICDTYKHSPVFRIGGDEFLCIIYHDDYTGRHE